MTAIMNKQQARNGRNLITAVEMRRALARMAHEIIERNKGVENLLLAGIPTRGVHLAHRLAQLIESFEKVRPDTAPLDPSGHRDDSINKPKNTTQKHHTNGMGDIDVSDMRVVIVDDVFHTGRTARAAMDALVQSGRPSYIQLAVLVNRGHRELPISPDFVGKNIPTSKSERVYVKLLEVDSEDSVVISHGWRNPDKRGRHA